MNFFDSEEGLGEIGNDSEKAEEDRQRHEDDGTETNQNHSVDMQTIDVAIKTYSLALCMIRKNVKLPNPNRLNANTGISATRDSAC